MKRMKIFYLTLPVILVSLAIQHCIHSSPDVISVTGTDLADTLRDNPGYTGVYKSYHTDGYLYSEVSYKDGKKDGISKRFYSDGKVHSVIEYREGKKVGTSKWLYTSGEVYRITPYSDGKIDGIQKKYYRDGTVQAEIPYVNGQRKVGLNEYNAHGKKVTSYPDIVIEPVDRIGTHGRYTLKIALSNNSENVKFYYNAVQDSIFKPDGKNYILTQSGVGMMEFVLKAEGGHPKDLQIVAFVRTRMGNSKILQKDFRLPSDRLSY